MRSMVSLSMVFAMAALTPFANARFVQHSDSENLVRCCLSQGDQGEQEGEPQTEPPECEELTAAECADEGGTVSSAESCDPNPCVSSPSGAFLN